MHIRYSDQIMNRISFETKSFINQSCFFGQVSNNQHNVFSLKNSFLLFLFLDAAAVAADTGHETDTRNDHKCVNL